MLTPRFDYARAGHTVDIGDNRAVFGLQEDDTVRCSVVFWEHAGP
ncbi:MAG: hypothetical protein R3F37_05640 [Candidatus Competibacteraceae bacterium]